MGGLGRVGLGALGLAWRGVARLGLGGWRKRRECCICANVECRSAVRQGKAHFADELVWVAEADDELNVRIEIPALACVR